MNCQKSFRNIVSLVLIILFLAGCSAPAPSPTPIPPTSTPLPPTSTPTPIPTREPTATILPTATNIPLTPTSSVARIPGSVMIAAGPSQLIVFGQRTATGEDGVHVADAETFDEVTTQKGIQMVLSGGGPQLFAFLGPQQFTNSAGGTALANVSVGSTEDPNVSVGVLWTSEIDGTFPSAEPLSLHEELFSMQSGTIAEEEGWLELGKIWLSDSSLQPQDQQEVFTFFLFHHGEETSVLGFLPNYKYELPPEDLKASAQVAHSGQDHLYLVKGFMGGSVYLPQEAMLPMSLPILQINYIGRVK
jgi:hypothetical protein